MREANYDEHIKDEETQEGTLKEKRIGNPKKNVIVIKIVP